MELADILDRAVIARLPVLIKARTPDVSGRRIVEVEASTEMADYDGDVILQKALLDSADSFVANGHLDIDHLSEFGARMGLPNPESYIIGRPMEVRRADNGRTFVKGEISRSRDGGFDPDKNRYDSFWQSLISEPPVKWLSSIYGFPTDLDDCKSGSCTATGATRYVIKAIDWRSLAFTRTPKNTGLTSPTRIISAKSYVMELAKGIGAMIPATHGPADTAPGTIYSDEPPGSAYPNSMGDVWKTGTCMKCAVHTSPTLQGYRYHFAKCMGLPPGGADLFAHAAMYKTILDDAKLGFDGYPGPQAGQ